MRRLAGDDPEVNEEWNCDKGRFAFQLRAASADRLDPPAGARRGRRAASPPPGRRRWRPPRGGLHARARRRRGVLTGGRAHRRGRLRLRQVRPGRARHQRHRLPRPRRTPPRRPTSWPRTSRARARPRRRRHLRRRWRRRRPSCWSGFEPEEEAPGVFLRLRKAYRKRGQQVVRAGRRTPRRGLDKAGGTLLPAAPGAEAEWLDALAGGVGLDDTAQAAEALRAPGAVILVGERLAAVPGGLTAALRLATATGARLGWVPRRAGERGAVEAGALPGAAARRPAGRRPARPRRGRRRSGASRRCPPRSGRDTGQILEAAAAGELGALLVGGVELADLPDPARGAGRARRGGFVVSLELRPSEVTERADVVLPVAAVAEKAGTFLNWEGRRAAVRGRAKPDQTTAGALPTPAC